MKKELQNPKLAVCVFILLILIVPFYESKRVLIWSTQRENQKENIFRWLVARYAFSAEEIKKNAGLIDFFEKERYFWLKLKKSPILFREQVKQEQPTESKEELKEEKNEVKAEPLPAEKIEAPFRILIIGDSMIAVRGGVGEILEGEFITYKDVMILRQGKVSSGLSRPDYFNWKLKTYELISQFQPNAVIVMLGLNDAQAITTEKGEALFNYGSEKWKEKYGERVGELLEIFQENNITVFWLGLPVMKSKIFSEKMKNLNSIYETEVQNFKNAYFISTWNLLADKDGNYAAYLPDEKGQMRLVRNSDGIHLQYLGGKILVKEVAAKIKGVLKLEKK